MLARWALQQGLKRIAATFSPSKPSLAQLPQISAPFSTTLPQWEEARPRPSPAFRPPTGAGPAPPSQPYRQPVSQAPSGGGPRRPPSTSPGGFRPPFRPPPPMRPYTPRNPPAAKGTIYIQSSRNNTIMTLVDPDGRTKAWSSSGCIGFKNSRKSTTFAAQAVAEQLAKKALKLGMPTLVVRIKGLGHGKESGVRALSKSGLVLTKIYDDTGLPHNGCRPPKKRRI